MMLARLSGEPLVHFLLMGGLLFGVHAWLNRDAQVAPADRDRTVRIAEGEVRWLVETWTRQWQRQPTREELRGLVIAMLREELLAREARELELDENDTIVRRRLAQKMSFLIEDTARLVKPGEEELRRYYATHRQSFQVPALISFTQIYFNGERRANAGADATAALARLSATNSTDLAMALGDSLLLDNEVEQADEAAVAAQFGADFARSVFALPPGGWHGPLASSYGVHLVRVSTLRPAHVRAYADVRAQVLDRFHEDRQRVADARYFAGLLEKYDIVVAPGVSPLIGPMDAGLAAGLVGSRESVATAATDEVR